MKKIVFVSLILILANSSFAQKMPEEYFDLCKKAQAFYKAKDYKNSAETYSSAFKANGWRASAEEFYNAACAWSLSKVPDSAFANLERSIKAGYSYNIALDRDFDGLNEDKRWQALLDKIKERKDKVEANLNKPLKNILDSIHMEDQQGRLQIDRVAKDYGHGSKEMTALWKRINAKDSTNLIVVEDILKKYGWLGADVVGYTGNSTLFLVIQHSNLKTQEKYLPMMREAVKKGNAEASSLALLEDRIALGQGKKQKYGSQISMDENNKHYVQPLEDPDNVDVRRAEVGLGPLSEYVSRWNIIWDVEQYKKDLPRYEKLRQPKKKK
jgi:hypothetical protein